MRISRLALLSLLLPAVHGSAGGNSTAPEHRVLGLDARIRRGPPLDPSDRRPRFRKGEIVIEGSPLTLPAGVKVVKYLKRADLTVVKVTGGNEHEIVEKLRKKDKLAEENFEMYASIVPNDEYYSPFQWHMDTVQARQAWEISTGENTIVAVLDTGLYNTKSQGGDGIGCIVSPRNTINDSSNVNDVDGHGTHVVSSLLLELVMLHIMLRAPSD